MVQLIINTQFSSVPYGHQSQLLIPDQYLCTYVHMRQPVMDEKMMRMNSKWLMCKVMFIYLGVLDC